VLENTIATIGTRINQIEETFVAKAKPVTIEFRIMNFPLRPSDFEGQVEFRILFLNSCSEK